MIMLLGTLPYPPHTQPERPVPFALALLHGYTAARGTGGDVLPWLPFSSIPGRPS